MATSKSKVAQGQTRSKTEGKAGDLLISRSEFDSICSQLKELTHVTVDAWATQDGYADGLEHVLVKLHAARRNLETAVTEVES